MWVHHLYLRLPSVVGLVNGDNELARRYSLVGLNQ